MSPVLGSDAFGGSSFIDSTYNATRIEWTDPSTVTLTPFIGSFILVARDPFNATDFAPLDIASNEMNPDGTDSGTPLAADTLYYVYACTRVSAFGMTLAASATAPTQVGADWYLGTTGETIYARFVGAVFTAGGAFVDDLDARLVWNQWNRIQRAVFVCPNYIDDAAQTTYVVNTATYAALNGGVDDLVRFITGPTSGVLAGDVSEFTFNAMIGAATTRAAFFAVYVDGGPDAPASFAFANAAPAMTTASVSLATTAQAVIALTTAQMFADTGGDPVTIVADNAATGSLPEDPSATFLSGLVWC